MDHACKALDLMRRALALLDQTGHSIPAIHLDEAIAQLEFALTKVTH